MYQLARNSISAVIREWKAASREITQLANQIPESPPANADCRKAIEDVAKQCDGAATKLNERLRTIDVPASVETLQKLLTTVLSDFRESLTFVTPPLPPETKIQGTIGIPFEYAVDKISGLANKPRGIENNVAACRERLIEVHSFILSRIEDIFEVGSYIGERANIRGIRGSVEDLSAYPLLTSDLGSPGPGTGFAGAGGGGASGTSARRQVEMAIRGVLGRVPRRADARSFVSALNQSFEVRQIEGRTEVAWRPHSFVGQADLSGGVTGAQASLAASAALGLDNVLPLLEGLYPLNSDADEEEGEALRAIVRSELIEVVNELKIEGGPRIARVDSLFIQLLGDETDEEGDLQELKSAFGLDEQHVNTLDEEHNSSNFIALEDFAVNLRTSWNNFKARGALGKDLGTRLVLLSRALTVCSESVEEILSAMDSVFVGPAERQVAAFDDRDGQSIILDELLSWITSFTTEEAPRLVQEGGRLGASTLIRTATLLANLVEHLIQVIPTEPTLPKGLQHARVVRPLYELAGYLDQVRRIADDISPS